MKKIVINIERRTDRKENFLKKNSSLEDIVWCQAFDGKTITYQDLEELGASTDLSWRDPYKKSKMTHGEVGCILSHRKAWLACLQLNEPVIIIEDDAIIDFDNYDEQYYQSLSEDYDLVYLQRNENKPDGVENIDDMIERPCYAYNTTCYMLTPAGANTLIQTNILKNIIPADEYLSYMFPHLKVAALKKCVVKQESRNVLNSDVEDTDYFIDFKVHPVTIGTDRKKCQGLNTSAALQKIYPKNIGENVEWEGTDMTSTGGGHKVNILREYVETLPDNDVLLFTDAYDILYNDTIDVITKRYLEFKKKVVFGAEEWCWPDKKLAPKFKKIKDPNKTKYQYLNSGMFMGVVSEIKEMLNDEDFAVENSGDDQLYYQNVFLSGKYDIILDYEGYIFQCDSESVHFNEYGQFTNNDTNCTGCIYHGNGGDESKKRYEEKKKTIIDRSPMLYIPHYGDVDYLDKDMFVIDFMTQTQCEDMIDVSERHGNWGSLAYDKFPAQEIRVKELGYWESLQKHWENHLYPIIERHWRPMEMYGLRDAFTMRYSTDTQKSLNLHTDASLVTGSVKLNNDYVGADLIFPRQNISNKDVPVGRAIIFPGQVTHGHECTELKSGIKYSLTMWTSRYDGDVL
jgi:GR25 family glycosyltransferase involved in LPS biosynthesis